MRDGLTEHAAGGAEVILGVQTKQVNEPGSAAKKPIKMAYVDFRAVHNHSVKRRPAVDIDRLAGHGAGLPRAQEQHSPRNLLRRLCAALQ